MEKENNFNNPTAIVFFLVLVAIGGYFLLSRNSGTSTNQVVQENPPSTQQAEIDALKQQVEDLKNQKPQTIIKEIPSQSTSIADIVSEWGPVIPIVFCNFNASNESLEGSAILFQKGTTGIFGILTNKHIINNGISFADNCEIQFPNDPQIITVSNVNMATAPDDVDAAQIIINNPDANIKELISKSNMYFCPSPPNVGDEIVILGYPAIGSSSGITATDGIVSGYDGNYYVTSAKVEHGNSGGVAIDVKRNCDLGVPTYVDAGSLESLARILKWQVFAPGEQEKYAINDKL
jgi:hypothetical protein